jgi:hypothetical protein
VVSSRSPALPRASVEHRDGMPCRQYRAQLRVVLAASRAERIDSGPLVGNCVRGPVGGDLQQSAWDVPDAEKVQIAPVQIWMLVREGYRVNRCLSTRPLLSHTSNKY